MNAASMVETSIHLRPVSEADVPHFFEHSQDEVAIRMAAPASPAGKWPEFARKWDRIRSDDAFLCRSVLLDDEVAGYIARITQTGVPSVSYWFARRFWGQGLARQALRLFLEEVSDRPLYARVAAGNAASLRVLALNGFVPIGTSGYFSAALGRDVEEVMLRLDG
jgi:RimJ/RimL family protein N-acetyltransferase